MKGCKSPWHKGRQLEQTLQAYLQPNLHTPGLRSLVYLLAHSGDGWFWFPGVALIYVMIPSLKAWAYGLGLGLLVTAALVMILKYLIRRQRPPGPYGQIYRKADPFSFPSGHAARAGVLFVYLGLTLPWPWNGLAGLWALALAWSRVALGVHYLSDVIAGWILGFIIGLWIVP